MVTIKDVAKLAKVSSATVSRMINGVGYISPELKKRIKQAIDELNYKPNLIARSLKIHSSKTIGFIFPDIENAFFIRLIKKAEEIAFKEGYSVILCNTENDYEKEKNYIEVLKGKLVDGFIVITSFKDKTFLESELAKEKVVFIDRDIGIAKQTLIKLDNVTGAEMAVDYLTGLGHERIGLVDVTTEITTGKERYEGYVKALKKKRIKPEQKYIKISGFSIEESMEKTRELLLMREKPTAILSISNRLTIGALIAIDELGLKIPDDISVIGFDDLRTARLLKPPLTVIDQPAYDFGEVGIKTLIKKIKGKKLEGKVINLKPKFIIRESCRAI